MKKAKITLNPEIKKQMEILFELLQKEEKKHHADHLAEAMSDQFGEYLKTHRGYSLLEYAHAVSQTESEQATMDLEEAFYHMKDEAAESLTDLSSRAVYLGKYWKKHKSNLDSEALHFLNSHIKMVTEHAEEVYSNIGSLWKWRAQNYRDELEDLRNKLIEAS